jgi:SH3 domain-containing protein
VNLRTGPGTNFATSEQLTDGSVLEVLALQGDWYKVRSPLGTTGWVAAENVPLDWIPDIYGGSGAPDGAASSDVVRIAQKYLGA